MEKKIGKNRNVNFSLNVFAVIFLVLINLMLANCIQQDDSGKTKVNVLSVGLTSFTYLSNFLDEIDQNSGNLTEPQYCQFIDLITKEELKCKTAGSKYTRCDCRNGTVHGLTSGNFYQLEFKMGEKLIEVFSLHTIGNVDIRSSRDNDKRHFSFSHSSPLTHDSTCKLCIIEMDYYRVELLEDELYDLCQEESPISKISVHEVNCNYANNIPLKKLNVAYKIFLLDHFDNIIGSIMPFYSQGFTFDVGEISLRIASYYFYDGAFNRTEKCSMLNQDTNLPIPCRSAHSNGTECNCYENGNLIDLEPASIYRLGFIYNGVRVEGFSAFRTTARSIYNPIDSFRHSVKFVLNVPALNGFNPLVGCTYCLYNDYNVLEKNLKCCEAAANVRSGQGICRDLTISNVEPGRNFSIMGCDLSGELNYYHEVYTIGDVTGYFFVYNGTHLGYRIRYEIGQPAINCRFMINNMLVGFNNCYSGFGCNCTQGILNVGDFESSLLNITIRDNDEDTIFEIQISSIVSYSITPEIVTSSEYTTVDRIREPYDASSFFALGGIVVASLIVVSTIIIIPLSIKFVQR